MQEETDLDVSVSGGRDFFAVDTVEDALNLVRSQLSDVLRPVDESAEKQREKHEMVVLDPDHGARR